MYLKRVETLQALEELRLLLKQNAILKAGADQPVLLPGGGYAPWMFYSWGATLTNRGAYLAGICILDRLSNFSSMQLATYGYTGMPILSACILLGEGKYTGLAIRTDRKKYGSCRQIEGPFDKSKPVVLIDDSISSGTATLKGIQALLEEGFQVEGVVCLVNFPWRGGVERLEALGYRVEFLFDIWKDLEMPQSSYTPAYKLVLPNEWGPQKVDDFLHPAHVARKVTEAYLANGIFMRPPVSLDKDYDGRGGVFVSFRDRESDHRIARDGFWHFNPKDADPCRDVVLAATKTIKASNGAISLETLPSLKIAVTFFGPLEKIKPKELDFLKYGIVVRSRVMETKMGGALPNTQVFTNEVEQYYHARVRNAKITEYEPHDIYRHELVKCVEPGEYWLPYGFPYDSLDDWTRNDEIGELLTKRVRELLFSLGDNTKAIIGDETEAAMETSGVPVQDDIIPAPVYAVSVSLYHKGLVGCGIAWDGSLDFCLKKATKSGFNDPRYSARRKDVSLEEIGIAVSILYDREWLGDTSIEMAASKIRRGLDSLSVQQGDRHAFFLPVVTSHYNYTKEQMAKKLLEKARIFNPPYTWATYKTASWLRRGNRQWNLHFGFTKKLQDFNHFKQWNKHISMLATYLTNHLLPNGIPEYFYLPVTGGFSAKGTSPRVVHALWALNEAGQLLNRIDWQEAAFKGFNLCLKHIKNKNGFGTLDLSGYQNGSMADCILLAGIAGTNNQSFSHEALKSLASFVLNMFQEDGRITPMPRSRGIATDHDFLPGAAILALAKYVKLTGRSDLINQLNVQLQWYKRRFRIAHPWGMVGWQTQGWSHVHTVRGDLQEAEFVFEMADWALDWQHEKTGAFLVELHPYGPSFHTAFLAEGIADAWTLAKRVGDKERAERYARSWCEAMKFMDTLIIHPQDTFCMVNPDKSVGGVRGCLTTSEVRIDYVSHTIMALVNGARNL